MYWHWHTRSTTAGRRESGQTTRECPPRVDGTRMEMEQAERCHACSPTHKIPSSYAPADPRPTPIAHSICTPQHPALRDSAEACMHNRSLHQRDQTNAEPTQDMTGSCWRRVLDVVPSGPPEAARSRQRTAGFSCAANTSDRVFTPSSCLFSRVPISSAQRTMKLTAVCKGNC